MLSIAIAAIMRNEAPYIVEWVSFHRAVGITHFVIVDDGSDDGTSDLLGRLAALGLVDHIRLNRRAGEPAQLMAYRQILRRYRHRFEWLAFIDADEFIVPTTGGSVLPMLAAAAPDTGAVLLNWATYGSSGRLCESTEPVVERFTARAAGDWHVDHHVKSIVRSRACIGTGTTPHQFRLASGWANRHADGTPFHPHPDFAEGLSERVVHAPVRINHYLIKSRQEFLERKRPRGRPVELPSLRPLDYFDDHDRNEQHDPVPDHLVAATRQEMTRISALLRRVPSEPLARRFLSRLGAVLDQRFRA